MVPEGCECLSQPSWYLAHGATGDAGDGDQPGVDACLLSGGAPQQLGVAGGGGGEGDHGLGVAAAGLADQGRFEQSCRVPKVCMSCDLGRWAAEDHRT